MSPLPLASVSNPDAVPVSLRLPDSLWSQLHPLKHAKKMTDDELACQCVTFCLRLIRDMQIDTNDTASFMDHLNRGLLDVQSERAVLLDVISGVEKTLADARALHAALQTRSAP